MMNPHSITMEPLDRSAVSLGPGCCLKSETPPKKDEKSISDEIGSHIGSEMMLGPIGGIFAAIQAINEKVGNTTDGHQNKSGDVVRQSRTLDVAPPKMQASIADDQAKEAADNARRRKLN